MRGGVVNRATAVCCFARGIASEHGRGACGHRVSARGRALWATWRRGDGDGGGAAYIMTRKKSRYAPSNER